MQPEQRFVALENRQADTERTLDFHTKTLNEHSKVLDGINQTLAKIVGLLATQQADIIAIKAKQDKHEELLKEQGQKLDLILQLLQKRGE